MYVAIMASVTAVNLALVFTSQHKNTQLVYWFINLI